MTRRLRDQPGGVTHASPMAGWVGRQLRGLAVATVAALFMTVIGPVGTDALTLWARAFYWLTLMLSGTMIGLALLETARHYDILGDRPFLQYSAVTLGLSAPQILIVAAANAQAFQRPVTGAAVAAITLPVLVISAAVTCLNYLAERDPRETHAAAAGAAPPRFLDRLPLRLRGGDIWAVQAEDHYLHIHTSRGQDLILMRLSDAIAELEGLEGAQTHRSWWVAREGINSAQRGNGRARLTLKSSIDAPVSRTFARALREAGWF